MNRMFDTLCAGSVFSTQQMGRRHWSVETVEMEGRAPHGGERVVRVRKYDVRVSRSARVVVTTLLDYSVFQHAFEQSL